MEVIWGKNQGKREMRIKADECAGLVMDIQERLFPAYVRKGKSPGKGTHSVGRD